MKKFTFLLLLFLENVLYAQHFNKVTIMGGGQTSMRLVDNIHKGKLYTFDNKIVKGYFDIDAPLFQQLGITLISGTINAKNPHYSFKKIKFFVLYAQGDSVMYENVANILVRPIKGALYDQNYHPFETNAIIGPVFIKGAISSYPFQLFRKNSMLRNICFLNDVGKLDYYYDPLLDIHLKEFFQLE